MQLHAPSCKYRPCAAGPPPAAVAQLAVGVAEISDRKKKQRIFCGKIAVLRAPAKKICGGQDSWGPKKCEPGLTGQDSQLPTWRWTSHHSKALKPDFQVLISGVALYLTKKQLYDLRCNLSPARPRKCWLPLASTADLHLLRQLDGYFSHEGGS